MEECREPSGNCRGISLCLESGHPVCIFAVSHKLCHHVDLIRLLPSRLCVAGVVMTLCVDLSVCVYVGVCLSV